MHYLGFHKIRNPLIFFCFVAGFLIVAPIVLASATGYRLHWQTLRFEKTALLVVQTQPGKAMIRIDDKLVRATSPTRVRNVFGGQHQIAVTAQGKKLWQKTVDLRAGETTFLDRIVLFEEQPRASSEQRVVGQLLSISPQATESLFRVDDQLVVVRSTDPKPRVLTTISTTALEVIWSPQGKFALVTTGDEGRSVLDMSNLSITPRIWQDTWSLVRLTDDGIIFACETTSNTMLTVSGQVATPISGWNTCYDDLLPRDSGHWFAITNNPAPQLQIINDRGQGDHISLPAGQWELLSREERVIAVRDIVRGSVLLYTENLSLSASFSRTKRIEWSPKPSVLSGARRELLIAQEGEISIYGYDRFTGKYAPTTLVRLSQPVTDVHWHATGDAILYRVGDKLSAVEVQARGGAQSWQLIEGDAISGYLQSNDGTSVVLLQEQGGGYDLQTYSIFTKDSFLR